MLKKVTGYCIQRTAAALRFTEAIKPLRLSPTNQSTFISVVPKQAQVPSLVSAIHPSSWPTPSPPINSEQTYRTSGQKCKRTPQNRASCCRQWKHMILLVW